MLRDMHSQLLRVKQRHQGFATSRVYQQAHLSETLSKNRSGFDHISARKTNVSPVQNKFSSTHLRHLTASYAECTFRSPFTGGEDHASTLNVMVKCFNLRAVGLLQISVYPVNEGHAADFLRHFLYTAHFRALSILWGKASISGFACTHAYATVKCAVRCMSDSKITLLLYMRQFSRRNFAQTFFSAAKTTATS